MRFRAAFSLTALAMVVTASASGAQTREQLAPRSGVFGIAAGNAKPDDRMNGRKRHIYDAEGRRDFRRGYDLTKVKDRQHMAFCQQYPGDDDCIGRRF